MPCPYIPYLFCRVPIYPIAHTLYTSLMLYAYKQDVHPLPGFVMPILRVPLVELAKGGEQLTDAYSDASGPVSPLP